MKTITKFHYDSVNKNLYANIDGSVVPIIKGSGVTRVASLPATGESGKIYYNESDRQYYTYDLSAGAFSTLGANTGYPVEYMGEYGAPFFLGNLISGRVAEYKEVVDGYEVFKDNLTFTFEEFEQVREDHILSKYGDWEDICDSSYTVGTLKFSCFDCGTVSYFGTVVYRCLIYDITIDFNAKTVSLKRRSIEPNIIYYFPRHGLWLRFVGVGDNLHPVVVNVERYYQKEPLHISTKAMDAVVPRVNEYIGVRNMENYLGIDATIINATPGGNLIDVCGRFEVPAAQYRILLTDCSLADNNPPLVSGHTYEYHILNYVLSYVDVTVTTTQQADR